MYGEIINICSRWADAITADGDAHDDTTLRSRCFYDYDQYVGQNVARSIGSTAALASVDDMALIQSGTQGWYDEVNVKLCLEQICNLHL